MNALMQVVAAYAAATLALLVIDLLWVSIVAWPRGRKRSGRGQIGFGLLAYGLLAVGLLVLAILPSASPDATPPPSQRSSLASAAPT